MSSCTVWTIVVRRRGALTHPTVLTNRAYVGDLVYGRERTGKFHEIDDDGEISVARQRNGAQRVKADAPIVILDCHEGIISREQFDRVQRKMSRNKRTHHKRRGGGYLLTGIIRCGHCGSGMYMHCYKGNQLYHVCAGANGGSCKARNIASAAIEGYAIDYLVEMIDSVDIRDGIRAAVTVQAERLTHADGDRRTTLEKRLRELEREIELGTDNMLKASSDDVFKLCQQRLEQSQAQAESLRREWRTATEKPRTAAADLVDAAMAELDELAANVKHADVSVARFALKVFYKTMTVWKRDKPRGGGPTNQPQLRSYAFSRGLLTMRPECEDLVKTVVAGHRL